MAGTESQKTPQDLDKNYAIIGVQGTLGTADTRGTSVTIPISADPDTGALYVKDLSGVAGTTNVQVLGGTLNSATVDLLKAGTITKVEGGTVGLITRVGNVGTLEVGTISTLPNIPGGTLNVVAAGTINSATAVLNSGTINVATAVITTLPNLPQGSINVTAGTIATLGTMGTLGLVNTVTTVSNLSAGSINVIAGTVSAGTINTGTINAGTIDLLKAGTVTRLEGGTIGLVTRVGNVGTLEVGTISALPNTPGGTLGLVTRVGNLGTVESGTIRINPVPTIHWMPFGTTTTGTIGTLVAAPSAGSAILLNSLDISVQNGTAEVLVSYGLVTTGNGVVSRGNYIAGGGLAKTYASPFGGSITGSALTYNILTGSGTVSYNIGYAIQIP